MCNFELHLVTLPVVCIPNDLEIVPGIKKSKLFLRFLSKGFGLLILKKYAAYFFIFFLIFFICHYCKAFAFSKFIRNCC